MSAEDRTGTVSATLRPPRHEHDPRARTWWRLQLLGGAAVVVVPLVVLGVLIAPARTWLLVPAAVLAAVGLAVAFALPAWWHRVHRWEVTDHAVYTREGYFWQTSRIAPMTRIQTVDTTRGPIQRSLGLATVVVTTASSAGAVRIAGLDHKQATEIAHELALVTNATPEDAT